MDASPEPSSDLFVSRFNRILAVVIWALVAVFVGAFVLNPALQERTGYLAVAPAVAFGAWAALWRPHLTVSDREIEVSNVFHTARVPWAALIDVSTKYALTLVTPNRSVSVWVAPAPGRTAALRATSKRDDTVPYLSGQARAGDRVSSDSGQAAYVVRRRWDALREAGSIEAGIADTMKPAYTVHWVIVAVLVVLTAGALSGVALA